MNPIVSLVIKELLAYVEAHPEVLQELIGEAIAAILGSIKAAHAGA